MNKRRKGGTEKGGRKQEGGKEGGSRQVREPSPRKDKRCFAPSAGRAAVLPRLECCPQGFPRGLLPVSDGFPKNFTQIMKV